MDHLFLQLTSIATGAVMFTSCAVGPNYHRPNVDSPGVFRFEKNASPESLADLPWWRVFKDSALQDLIREALRNNYDLRIAIERIEQARAQQIQTRSEFFPQLGYGANATRTRGPETRVPARRGTPTTLTSGTTTITIPAVNTPATTTGGATTNNFQVQTNASWEIDLWGRIRRANEAALARLLATVEARRGVTQTLVADVAETYLRLRELDLELEIARRTVGSFGESLNIFSTQQRGGLASDLEVARANAAQANAAATIPDIERRIAQTENQLSILVGRNPGPIRRGSSLVNQPTPPRVPAGIPAALLERRPDIRQAEQNVVASNAEIGVAIGEFLPRIDLTAAAGAVSPQLHLLTSGQGNNWNIGGSITGPIFQGGRLYGQLKEAKSATRESILQYQRTALNAFGDVSDALIARQKYTESRAQLERQVNALNEAVRLSRQRYTVGVSSYYEILEAQQQLFPAEVSLAQSRLNQLLTIVQLYQALGGGWRENEPLFQKRSL